MLDWQVSRLTQELRKHDKSLFASRAGSGVIRVLRKADRLEASDFNQSEPDLASLNPQLILALTDTWRIDGRPVEWGIEPVIQRIKSMDAWNYNGDILNDLRKKREADEEYKRKQYRNEIGDRAAELQSQFADIVA